MTTAISGLGGVREAVLRRLRGRYNSVRYRFWVLPRDRLIYLFRFRLMGKGFSDFYGYRLDREARISAKKPIAEGYIDSGAAHLDYLKQHGLLPHHRLLDYGCGYMRSGLYLARYLEPNRYVGVDLSGERLKAARKLASQAGIDENHYTLRVVEGLSLAEIAEFRFDYVFACAVIPHMPRDDIVAFFRNVRSLLAPGGQILFEFTLAERYTQINIKDFFYPVAEMKAMAVAAGYVFELLDDWTCSHPSNRMVRLVPR